MKTKLNDEKILLQQLTINDSLIFHSLYFPNGRDKQNLAAEETKTPIEFTKHIISLCNNIFTIRLIDNPTKIIGECALHDLNKERKEIEIGGTLFPEYWGHGIMASAFQILIEFAKQEYAVNKIIAKTEITNDKALRFADKLGFKKITQNDQTIILEKMI